MLTERHSFGLDIKGVPPVARWVFGRDVQESEIVLIRLDFGPFDDVVAETVKSLDDLADDCRDRVELTHGQWAPGQGHVDSLAIQLGLTSLAIDLGLTRRELLFEKPLDVISDLADDAPVGWLEGGQTTQGLIERAPLAEIGDSPLFEPFDIANSTEVFERLRA